MLSTIFSLQCLQREREREREKGEREIYYHAILSPSLLMLRGSFSPAPQCVDAHCWIRFVVPQAIGTRLLFILFFFIRNFILYIYTFIYIYSFICIYIYIYRDICICEYKVSNRRLGPTCECQIVSTRSIWKTNA